MKPSLHHFGNSNSAVVVIDDFTGDFGALADIAADLAPFPADVATYYPGLRRHIGTDDGAAYDYVIRLLEAAAPFIGGGFDAARFDLLGASYSMVTTAPEKLAAAQRAPHFDSTDPGYLALLHYLSDTPGSGTAFYRQRSTGIECVDEDNVSTFVAQHKKESARLYGYTNASNGYFEQIGMVDAVPDRLVIYQGCLLHSGIIPTGMDRSGDPRTGRLTANIFVQGHRE